MKHLILAGLSAVLMSLTITAHAEIKNKLLDSAHDLVVAVGSENVIDQVKGIAYVVGVVDVMDMVVCFPANAQQKDVVVFVLDTLIENEGNNDLSKIAADKAIAGILLKKFPCVKI